MVACNIKGDLPSTQYVEFTVAGEVEEEPGDDINSNAVIDSLEITPAQVPAAGGEVRLKIFGTGLTADNWDILAEVYFRL